MKQYNQEKAGPPLVVESAGVMLGILVATATALPKIMASQSDGSRPPTQFHTTFCAGRLYRLCAFLSRMGF